MGVTKSNDLDELKRLVESDSEIYHLLAATPFSVVENASYDSHLTPELFRQLFYVEGDDLSKLRTSIQQTLRGGRRNLVLVSGYKGCGKTIFVHYLAQDLVADGLGECRTSSTIIDFEQYSQEAEEEYNEDPEASKFKKSLVVYLRNAALGLGTGNGAETTKASSFTDTQWVFTQIFEERREYLESKDLHGSFLEFGERYSDLPSRPSLADKKRLEKLIGEMDLKTLFFASCLLTLSAEVSTGDAYFRHIFVFDNLDDEIDENKISRFINCFHSFVSSHAGFFDSLRSIDVEGCDLTRCAFYKNFAFVFCLRDTNAAKFTGHMKDRNFAYERDISTMVPRQDIIGRRLDFLEKSCDLSKNTALKMQGNIYRSLLNDKYVFERVYPLFNNNQRKVASVLQDVFVGQEHASIATEYRNLVTYGDKADVPDAIFGAHGLLARLLIDKFNDEGYISRIGGLNREVSIPRLVLTQLFNSYSEHVSSAVPNDAKMSLEAVWESLRELPGVDKRSFVESIEGMFSLFEEQYWSHLLEIDSITRLSSTDLLSEIGGAVPGPHTSLYITCAGRIFVSQISSHFEYFASRYQRDYAPLFSGENLVVSKGRPPLVGLLEGVFEEAKSCMLRVREIDRRLCDSQHGGDEKMFLNSEFLYCIPKRSHYPVRGTQTHSERIISKHLGYIDAYRMFLLSLENRALEREVLTEESREDFRRNRDVILCALLETERRYIEFFQSEMEVGHITDSGQELLHMFKAAYLRVQDDKRGILQSRYPIGRLDMIRDEFSHLNESQQVWQYKAIEARELMSPKRA